MSMHIIEAIGIEEPRRMSDIAKRLNVTMGTLTTNMNSLEEKGYIIRERSKTDKRVVLVVLTPKGKKAFCHHRGFHRNMIKAIVRGLDEDEMKVMIKCLLNLNEFLRNMRTGSSSEGLSVFFLERLGKFGIMRISLLNQIFMHTPVRGTMPLHGALASIANLMEVLAWRHLH